MAKTPRSTRSHRSSSKRPKSTQSKKSSKTKSAKSATSKRRRKSSSTRSKPVATRAPSAYNLFAKKHLNELRQKLEREGKPVVQTQLMKKVGEMWTAHKGRA
jgi:N-acetyl-gamma-glutamylphosphate reductase